MFPSFEKDVDFCNLFLTFYFPNRRDKNSYRAKTPSTQRNTHCHFDRREKSFLDPSHSFGMTALARHLGALCAFARVTVFPMSLFPLAFETTFGTIAVDACLSSMSGHSRQ
jgi:hypothetical protein